MWNMGTYSTVLGAVVFCGLLENTNSVSDGKKPGEFSPCPYNYKRNADGDCKPEHHDEYTEYYIWIGIVSGLVVLLGVALLSCVCCKCCLIYKRRIALENARACHNAAISTISSRTQIGHGAHGPVSSQFGLPLNTSLPRIDNNQHQMTSSALAERAAGQYSTSPIHQRLYDAPDSGLPKYMHSPIPVFPDEPPPRYTP